MSAPLSSSAVRRLARASSTMAAELELLEAGGVAADARERQEVVDQVLHALGPVDHEGDVLVGAVVELTPVAALEELAEAGDLAQRLLQVVRRDVRELLEVGVGALQLERLRLDGQVGLAQPIELTEDLEAHRIDVGGQTFDLGCPLDRHRPAQVPAGDAAHLVGQLDDGARHRAVERDGDDDAEGHEADQDADGDRPHPLRGLVEREDRRAPLHGQVLFERVEAGADLGEELTAPLLGLRRCGVVPRFLRRLLLRCHLLRRRRRRSDRGSDRRWG